MSVMADMNSTESDLTTISANLSANVVLSFDDFRFDLTVILTAVFYGMFGFYFLKNNLTFFLKVQRLFLAPSETDSLFTLYPIINECVHYRMCF